jgi:hypothetical protein
MKKILVAITLLTFTSSIFAQTFNFGIKGGINSHKITTDSPTLNGYTFSDFVSDAQAGYHIGGFARIGGKNLYLQPELLYTLKKGSSSFDVTGSPSEGLPTGSYTQSVDLKAIQIPLLVGLKLINLKLASIRVFTGPAMSVILNGSQMTITNSLGDVFNPSTFKNNVWDWQLGGGVDVGSFIFDVRYEWGLTNVSEGDITQVGFVNKGNTLTFSVGFKFL